MGNWGIANTAPENEKIKAEVADYLNGLNSVGKIDYPTYSEAFNLIMDAMDRLYASSESKDEEIRLLRKAHKKIFSISCDGSTIQQVAVEALKGRGHE